MLRIVVDPVNPDPDIMSQAGNILRRGGLVAFPTETVYGLGADALNPGAVSGVYRVKGRPSDNPLILHGNSMEQLKKVAIFPSDPNSDAHKLAEAFWPGPLTMVLDKGNQLKGVSQKTVAVRVPSHPVSRALIHFSDCIIAAPSANKSGRPSPTQAWHVEEDFDFERPQTYKISESGGIDLLIDGGIDLPIDGGIDLLIDGGPTHAGLESTVVDLHTGTPRLLRPGAVTLEMLRLVLDEIELTKAMGDEEPDQQPLSPGMKYRHYAPQAPLILLIGSPEDVRAKAKCYGSKAGFLPSAGQDPGDIARDLFNNLRQLDRDGVSVIVAEGVREEGIGLAIMNRLKKAAAEVIFL